MLLCDNLDLTIRNTEPSKYILTKLDFTGANGTYPLETAHNYTVYAYNGDIQRVLKPLILLHQLHKHVEN